MAPEDCYELVSWIIWGEEGLNPLSSMFEWVGQHVHPTTRGIKRSHSVLGRNARFVLLPIKYILLIYILSLDRISSDTEEARKLTPKKKKLKLKKSDRLMRHFHP